MGTDEIEGSQRYRGGCRVAGGLRNNRNLDDPPGHWVAPWIWLNRIKPDDSLAYVTFWLGEPDKIDGESYYWVGGKGEIGHFKLIIRDGRLISVSTSEHGDIPN
jgi:hypothetical protein